MRLSSECHPWMFEGALVYSTPTCAGPGPHMPASRPPPHQPAAAPASHIQPPATSQASPQTAITASQPAARQQPKPGAPPVSRRPAGQHPAASPEVTWHPEVSQPVCRLPACSLGCCLAWSPGCSRGMPREWTGKSSFGGWTRKWTGKWTGKSFSAPGSGTGKWTGKWTGKFIA